MQTNEIAIKNVLNVSVFGVIGVGKTTIVEQLEIALSEHDINVHSIKEPINKWKAIGLLGAFYVDMKKYAYTFQQYVFSSRLAQFKDLDLEKVDLILSDGHVIMDRYCFAELLNEDGFIDEKEMSWYKESYRDWRTLVPFADPDLIIYLKIDDMEVPIKRISKRNRNEEKGIQPEYIKKIDSKLLALSKMKEYENKILIVDASKPVDEILKEIRSNDKFKEIIEMASQRKLQIKNAKKLDLFHKRIDKEKYETMERELVDLKNELKVKNKFLFENEEKNKKMSKLDMLIVSFAILISLFIFFDIMRMKSNNNDIREILFNS